MLKSSNEGKLYLQLSRKLSSSFGSDNKDYVNQVVGAAITDLSY